jgi:hypothetical protein
MQNNTSEVVETVHVARRRRLREAAGILRSSLVVNGTHAGDVEGMPADEWAKAGMLDCIQENEKLAEEAV